MLVRLDDGSYLSAAAGAAGAPPLLLRASDHAGDDGAMWLDEGEGEGRVLWHASTSVATPAAALAAEAGCQLKLERAPSFVLERGLDCLPSATLAHLRAKGWAVMRELIEPAHVARLKAACDLATSPDYAGPAVVETSAEKHFVQNLLGQVRKTPSFWANL